jgi:tol-pal system protein YbgF
MARSLALFSMLVMLSGCASAGFGPSEEWRLRNLEESFLEFSERQQEQSRRISDLEKSMADLMAEFREMEMAASMGRSAESEVSEETRQALEMYENMFEAAGKEPEKPAEQELPEEAETAEEMEADTPADKKWEEYAEVEEPAGKTREEPEPIAEDEAETQPEQAAAVKKKADMGDDPVAAYKKGLNLVRGGEPVRGRRALESFTARWPGHGLAPNALYWIGESFYNEDRYDKAILAFKEVYRRFPEHPKAAASLLKTAYSYQKIGDVNNAKFHLTVLIEDFPDSDPAALARKRMNEI